MVKKSYSEKLKSPLWQRRRLEILQRDNFTCVLCGDTETELQINHLKYTGEPHEAPNEDLETLCKHCHKIKHEFDGIDVIKVFKLGKANRCNFVIKTEKTTFFGTFDGDKYEFALKGFVIGCRTLKLIYEVNKGIIE